MKLLAQKLIGAIVLYLALCAIWSRLVTQWFFTEIFLEDTSFREAIRIDIWFEAFVVFTVIYIFFAWIVLWKFPPKD